ncbi:uncharacterized protein [Aristolochia californica]|uniref:uncharacterized protein isoform X2 n=1 Tax=Aristolochia californica TaxID=171875 RepID=UPI0035E24029
MEIDNREQALDQSVPPGSDSSIKKTPPRSVKRSKKIQLPVDDGTKNSGPEPVKVPKAFDFPERYMSPTDRLISPVSKRVLARNRKEQI